MTRGSCLKVLIALVIVCCINLTVFYKHVYSSHYHLAVLITNGLERVRLIQGEASLSEKHGIFNFDTNSSSSDFGHGKKHFTDGADHSSLKNMILKNRDASVNISSPTGGDSENLSMKITHSSSNSVEHRLLNDRRGVANSNDLIVPSTSTNVQAGHVRVKKKPLVSSSGSNSLNDSATGSVSNTFESVANVPDEASNENVYTNTTKSFLLDNSFSSPWHNSRSVETIQKEPWFKELTTFLLNSVPNSPIVLVASDSDFQDALLNWLISALLRQTEPVTNILVLTYRPSLCVFINSKQIVNCISIVPYSLTSEDVYTSKRYNGMYRLLVIRVFVMRLLTYWGYNVANFDTDAILLKNPIPVLQSPEFSNSDVIGTFGGSLPGALHNKWGVVLCMGAIFLRSTSHTERLWESMRRVKQRDDQIKMNYGLDNLHVRWITRNINQTDPQGDLSKLWEGEAEGGLRVTLLPQRMACRLDGCRQDSKHGCYIWHHGRNQHKSKNMIGHAINDGVWFLKKDWHSVPSHYTGWDWLRAIATPLK